MAPRRKQKGLQRVKHSSQGHPACSSKCPSSQESSAHPSPPPSLAKSPPHSRFPSTPPQVTPVARHHFSSSLQRMSAVALARNFKTPAGGSSTSILCLVKGSPESLSPLLRSKPGWYDETYTRLAQRGLRVLALGYRLCEGTSAGEVAEAARRPREWVDDGLECAGMLAFGCAVSAGRGGAGKGGGALLCAVGEGSGEELPSHTSCPRCRRGPSIARRLASPSPVRALPAPHTSLPSSSDFLPFLPPRSAPTPPPPSARSPALATVNPALPPCPFTLKPHPHFLTLPWAAAPLQIRADSAVFIGTPTHSSR